MYLYRAMFGGPSHVPQPQPLPQSQPQSATRNTNLQNVTNFEPSAHRPFVDAAEDPTTPAPVDASAGAAAAAAAAGAPVSSSHVPAPAPVSAAPQQFDDDDDDDDDNAPDLPHDDRKRAFWALVLCVGMTLSACVIVGLALAGVVVAPLNTSASHPLVLAVALVVVFAFFYRCVRAFSTDAGLEMERCAVAAAAVMVTNGLTPNFRSAFGRRRGMLIYACHCVMLLVWVGYTTTYFRSGLSACLCVFAPNTLLANSTGTGTGADTISAAVAAGGSHACVCAWTSASGTAWTNGTVVVLS